jgi:hypothetical protein
MTKQPNRIKVKETERYWGDFEGSLESIIASLQNELDKEWEGIENQCVRYEDYSTPYLYKHREENDKEYEKRMKQLDKEKQVKDAAKIVSKEHRRKEYERLKKEFEDTP